jgi:hypothetical protein
MAAITSAAVPASVGCGLDLPNETRRDAVVVERLHAEVVLRVIVCLSALVASRRGPLSFCHYRSHF